MAFPVGWQTDSYNRSVLYDRLGLRTYISYHAYGATEPLFLRGFFFVFFFITKFRTQRPAFLSHVPPSVILGLHTMHKQARETTHKGAMLHDSSIGSVSQRTGSGFCLGTGSTVVVESRWLHYTKTFGPRPQKYNTADIACTAQGYFLMRLGIFWLQEDEGCSCHIPE